MPYKLSGVLKSPNGQPLTGVDIQFVAQQTQSPVLQQTDHNIRLGLDGAYNVTLENNTYAVKAQINGLGPQHMGYILISSDTPAGLDLPQLLRSYSQQSTAPDYAQLIEKWLAEAKSAADTSTAQAASAKSQADRAQSEADRASQISGLDTVADAIGLAAVPFPDVWIPFNDSLRMFAGYGREVKVGDDVVARMVNFERSTTATYIDKSGVLRTAAINEPRFEKQGLLIEGQSTNLTRRSEDWDFYNHVTGGATEKTETGQNPYGSLSQIKSAVCAKANSNVSLVGVPTDMPEVKSLSVFFNIKTAPSGFYFYVSSSSSSVSISSTGEISSVASGLSATVKQVGGAGWRRLTISSTIAVSRFSLNLANVGDEVALWGVQTEVLPFASSYIPTNGAAVTRAADKCWIQLQSNLPLPIKGVTISLTASIQNASDSRLFEINDGNTVVLSAQDSRMYPRFNKLEQTGVPVPVGINRVAFRIGTDGGITSYIGLAAYSGPTRASGSDGAIDKIAFGNNKDFSSNRGLFGHIRDLKIWHHPLSDTQIRGIK